MKYRRRLEVVSAVQWHPDIKTKCIKKHKGCEYRMCPICGGASKDQIIIYIETSEGIIVDISLIEN